MIYIDPEPSPEEALSEVAILIAECEMFNEDIRGVVGAIRKFPTRSGNPNHDATGRFASSPGGINKAVKFVSRKFTGFESKEGEFMDAYLKVVERFNPRLAKKARAVWKSSNLVNQKIIPIIQLLSQYSKQRRSGQAPALSVRERLWALAMAVNPSEFKEVMDKQVSTKKKEGTTKRIEDRKGAPQVTPKVANIRYDPRSAGAVQRTRKTYRPNSKPGEGGNPGSFGGGF